MNEYPRIEEELIAALEKKYQPSKEEVAIATTTMLALAGMIVALDASSSACSFCSKLSPSMPLYSPLWMPEEYIIVLSRKSL